MPPEMALEELKGSVGTKFDPDAYEGLVSYVQGGPVVAAPPDETPGGLSDREVEVLQQLAKGARNREIAETLVISEKTVERHHREHLQQARRDYADLGGCLRRPKRDDPVGRGPSGRAFVRERSAGQSSVYTEPDCCATPHVRGDIWSQPH